MIYNKLVYITYLYSEKNSIFVEIVLQFLPIQPLMLELSQTLAVAPPILFRTSPKQSH